MLLELVFGDLQKLWINYPEKSISSQRSTNDYDLVIQRTQILILEEAHKHLVNHPLKIE